MGGHRFRPVGFSPHSTMVIRAVARDWSLVFFPRVFFSLNVSSNTSWQLLIYPVGEIPKLSVHSLHPCSSGKEKHNEEAYGNVWAGSVASSGVEHGSSSHSGEAGMKRASLCLLLGGHQATSRLQESCCAQRVGLSQIPLHGKWCLPGAPACPGCLLPPACVLPLVVQSRPALCW